MRIGDYGSINRVNSSVYPNRVERIKKVSNPKEAPIIRDIYEPMSKQIKTDFGGYNKYGRKNVENKNIMSDYSKILNISSNELSDKMKQKGVFVEDLVNPDKSEKLSDEPYTKKVLRDFASMERKSLLEDSGMTDKELDNLVDNVHKIFE